MMDFVDFSIIFARSMPRTMRQTTYVKSQGLRNHSIAAFEQRGSGAKSQTTPTGFAKSLPC
jgi:hypothetical protein